MTDAELEEWLMKTNNNPLALMIDDDLEFGQDIKSILIDRYRIEIIDDVESAFEFIRTRVPQVVLLDIELSHGVSGITFLKELVEKFSDHPPVIMLTVDDDISTVVEAIKAGAVNYICKPPNMDYLTSQIDAALELSNSARRITALETDLAAARGGYIAEDPVSVRLLGRVDLVATTECSVLITGESGTGKEMVARRIHENSPRCGGPFVGINCSAISSELIETELFGHVKGAFTGSAGPKNGMFELARGGTLFLDEIGDSPDQLQVKLLRVLETHEYFKVGGEIPIRTDVRVLAATSQDVKQLMAEKRFRRELYFRLNVFPIHVPPLRRRPQDILPLALHFLNKVNSDSNKSIVGFSKECSEELSAQHWEGNVRELRNLVERMALLCSTDIIDRGDLYVPVDTDDYDMTLADAKTAWEVRGYCQYLTCQLELTGGKVPESARRAGITRQSFYKLMKKYGVDADRFR